MATHPSERGTVARDQCGMCGDSHLDLIARALSSEEA
jgi:hypothetical protein